jgi:hypothetical protein
MYRVSYTLKGKRRLSTKAFNKKSDAKEFAKTLSGRGANPRVIKKPGKSKWSY